MALGPINEHSSAVFTVTLRKDTGVPCPNADLATVTLTLYDKVSDELLGGRDNQDVLGANGVTIDENGVLTWQMQPADNAIVNQDRRTAETHVALFTWAWANGHHHEAIEIDVTPLRRVP